MAGILHSFFANSVKLIATSRVSQCFVMINQGKKYFYRIVF